jgi:hypothetical protein
MTHFNHKIEQELKDNIANLVSIVEKNPNNKEVILDYIITKITNDLETTKDNTKIWDPSVIYDENGYPRF